MITDYYCRGVINKILTSTPMSNMLNALTFNVDSELPSGSSERYDFLGTVPAVREWVGGRQSSQPIEYNYTVINKKWEDTVRFPLEWIMSDKTGNVQDAVAQLGARMAQWKSQIVATLINNATDSTLGKGFDAVSFFNSAHVFGQVASQSNTLTYTTGTGAGLTPTPYEVAKAIVLAVQQMLSFLDDRGQPINEDMNSIAIAAPIVSAGTGAAAAFQAINLPKIDTGSGSIDNPVFGLTSGFLKSVALIPTPRITLGSSKVFGVFNTTPGARPFVFQENTSARRMTVKGAGSDFEHDSDAWEYGLRLIGNGGYGRWTDAQQIVFA